MTIKIDKDVNTVTVISFISVKQWIINYTIIMEPSYYMEPIYYNGIVTIWNLVTIMAS